MKLHEIISDVKPNGDNEYTVTYTTNRGRQSKARVIYAKTKKDAVEFVLKRLGTPTKIDGKEIDLGKLDQLD